MEYLDMIINKFKCPRYENRLAKLDRRDNEFTAKQFHNIRQYSIPNKKILGLIKKNGTCLNSKSTNDIPSESLNRVCFILINNYEDDSNNLGIGPLNDGYLVSLTYKLLGFNVFYLFNSKSEEFLQFFKFFLKNTNIELTIFYTGHNLSTVGLEGIEFSNGYLSKNTIGNSIAHNCSGKARVLFITDGIEGGSVFDIDSCYHQKNSKPMDMISFYVNKSTSPISKESQKSHGIFTYYFCKIISECPNITPDSLVDKINPSLSRFNEVFQCEISNEKLVGCPIFSK